MDPLVIAGQGHFFTGIREHTGPAGTSVYGTHVQWQSPPSVRDNLVLVHGGGGQALDMLSTPDGRPGWATLFLRDGFAVYTVDRPGMGRSPYHRDIHGEQGPPAAYEGFVATFAAAAPPGFPRGPARPRQGDRGFRARRAAVPRGSRDRRVQLRADGGAVAAVITDWIVKHT
jgi:hypothetical protein